MQKISKGCGEKSDQGKWTGGVRGAFRSLVSGWKGRVMDRRKHHWGFENGIFSCNSGGFGRVFRRVKGVWGRRSRTEAVAPFSGASVDLPQLLEVIEQCVPEKLGSPPFLVQSAKRPSVFQASLINVLYDLEDIAAVLGADRSMVAQWFYDGHPKFEMPIPDVLLSSGPKWFSNRIWPWIRTIDPFVGPPPEIVQAHPSAVAARKQQSATLIYNKARADFEEMGEQVATAELAVLGEDFSKMARVGMAVSAEPDWLVDVADRLAQAGCWSAFDIDDEVVKSPSSIGVFCRGLRGVRTRNCGAIEDAVSDLAAALRSPLLPSKARDFLRFQKATIDRDMGLYGIVGAEYDAIATAGGPYADQARYCQAYLAFDAEGRFSDVLDKTSGIVGPFLDVRVLLLRGNVYRVNGRFADAEIACRKALAKAREADARGLEGRALTCLAETLCWTRPAEGHYVAEEAVRVTREVKNKIHELRAHAALAIASVGRGPEGAVDDALDKASLLVEATGDRTGDIRVLTARAFAMVSENRLEELRQIWDRMQRQTAALGSNAFWSDILCAWDSSLSYIPELSKNHHFQWLDGLDNTMGRWRDVLIARRG